MWYETGIAQELAKDYRVIAIDLREHGRSDKPEFSEDYGPKMGLDLINLLDYLQIEKAHLIGHSMGAFVIGRLVETHPLRISSATLASGSFPVANEDEKIFQEETAKVTTPIQTVFGSEEKGDFFNLQKR